MLIEAIYNVNEINNKKSNTRDNNMIKKQGLSCYALLY